MRFWLFKVADQNLYPDRPGHQYVFDNTHTTRMSSGDEFIYLDKRSRQYQLTGAGRIARLTSHAPVPSERRTPRVQRVFTAQLDEVVWFSTPLDLRPNTEAGRSNRLRLGLPEDVNAIGWSFSVPRLTRDLFMRLLDAALNMSGVRPPPSSDLEWEIEDSYSVVRTRTRLNVFRAAVLRRHNYRCVVCGTTHRDVLDVAHIRSYATDRRNRANPGNGLCLCRYCHALYDAHEIAILPTGELWVRQGYPDPILRTHLTAVEPSERKRWLVGVDSSFLSERVGRLTSEICVQQSVGPGLPAEGSAPA